MLQKKRIILSLLSLCSYTLHASFIESTMGTAVVNDATATYHNPAALTLIQKFQMVALDSKASSHNRFTGHSINTSEHVTQSGISKEHAHYNLPSGYAAFPIQDKAALGWALLLDNLHSDLDEPSILKYDQSSNQIKNIDYVAGAGLQLNQYLSVGVGAAYSTAHFNSQRIIKFPRLDAPDSQSHNRTKGDHYGWNAGFLVKPLKSMQIGFNYRSAIAYPFYGSSEFDGPPGAFSNQFHFNFWTPARSVATVSHFLTPTLGFIATAQWVQWGVFQNVIMHELAVQTGRTSRIVPSVKVPYYFRDAWVLTIGGIKNITSDWVLRVAGTYNQSPGNGYYRITSGDDYVLGASTSYQIHKNIVLDASYAHAFTKDQAIDIVTQRKKIVGINQGYRDSISLKVTLSL